MKPLPLVLPLAFMAFTGSTQAVGYAIPAKKIKAEAKAFAKTDKDGNEEISFEEFKALLKPLAVALKKFPATGRGDHPEELLELCEEVFDHFDADLDGSVNFEEWASARQRVDRQAIADLLFGLPGLDRNGNGRVHVMEFLSLVKCFFPLSKAKAVHQQIVHPYTSGGVIQIVGGATLDLGHSGGQLGSVGSLELGGSVFTVEWAPVIPNGGILEPGSSAGVVVLNLDLGTSGSWTLSDLVSLTPWFTITFPSSLPEKTLQLPIDGSASTAP